MRQFLNKVCFLVLFFFMHSVAMADVTEANDTSCNAPFELSTQGSKIVDQCGRVFKLKSVNWYGAHESPEVVGGLNKQPVQHVVNLIKQGGFNSVRLTFSNDMLHNQEPVKPQYVAANPELINKTPLQVFDAVVNALTNAGIVVILNNHTTTSEWCCGFDLNGLWHHPALQSTADWVRDWRELAKRYRNNPLVAGADLRNEVRTTRYQNSIFPVYPNWSLGDKNDWKLAATTAGNEIHAINQKLLIIVEGINWTGIPMLNGYRPVLESVRYNPIVLHQPNKLVYEAHNYSYTGPKHTGDSNSSIGRSRYRDMDMDVFRSTLNKEFGYVLEPGNIYTAPVWLGEFGVAYSASNEDKRWFRMITNYLIEKDMGWAYWALNPVKGDGSEEGYGLLTEDWSAYREDWRIDLIKRLMQE